MILHFIANHFTAAFYGSYALLFAVIAAWEYFAPRRPLTLSRFQRWPRNFSFFLLGTLLLQFLSTATTGNLAYLTWKNGWGLLNQFGLSPLLHFFLSLLLLDFEVYALHVLYHKIPAGWRIHRVHHTDLDLDASSGLLFHPLESLVSFLIRQPFILLAGPSPSAVYAFDLFFILFLLGTHSNIRLFPLLDVILRWFFVTPDMHRIHHSKDWGESNSNYGFSLSWWDRLFRTYRPLSKQIPQKMNLGLAEFQSPKQLGFLRLILLPFLPKNRGPGIKR